MSLFSSYERRSPTSWARTHARVAAAAAACHSPNDKRNTATRASTHPRSASDPHASAIWTARSHQVSPRRFAEPMPASSAPRA
jgi:hypothetical protein